MKYIYTVRIRKLNKTYTFREGEKIATEISRKHNDNKTNKIIENSNLKITTKLNDNTLSIKLVKTDFERINNLLPYPSIEDVNPIRVSRRYVNYR